MENYNLDLLLELIWVRDSISFRTKSYQGNTKSLQVNKDKTFHYNYTSLTNNVVITNLNNKALGELHNYLISNGYKESKAIDY